MKSRLKLAAYTALLLIANCALVSCQDEPSTTETQSSDKANMPAPQSIGSLEGTIGENAVSTTLNTQDSSIVIEEWDGISDNKQQRDSGEMSFEAFLLGTDLWNGPPRMVTITHQTDDITLTLRFAGRLAIDEKLTALPGCLIETSDAPLVPAAKGSWKTAKNVTLPRYDLILQVTSFDEPGNVITGIVKGQLIDPTKPGTDPLSIELALSSANPSMSDTNSDTRVPANHLIIDADTQPASIIEEQPVPAENGEQTVHSDTAPSEPSDPGLNPAAQDEEQEDIEIRRAIPVSPNLQNE